MNKKENTIEEFRKLLKENHRSVSEIEYTSNNFDNSGKLINQLLPTITTDFCEIGLYKNKVYFVFIIASKSFNKNVYDSIKTEKNLKIYPLKDFKSTLYPKKLFNYKKFFEEIKKEEYLQIQFEFKKLNASGLYQEYFKLVKIFKKSKTKVINQLRVSGKCLLNAKIKRDKYFRKRGSYARIIKVKCAKCGKILFSYQKDGPGWLKRCYLNRIISEKKFEPSKMLKCHGIIGIPKKHKDGRDSFQLVRGKFKRTYGSPKIK